MIALGEVDADVPNRREAFGPRHRLGDGLQPKNSGYLVYRLNHSPVERLSRDVLHAILRKVTGSSLR